ncbi:hypothetical protein H7I87_03025 [Mycobacterium timonense]|uniref:Uncharacterized protein n=1 Tax=Mycobacterium bouchedurhonense TaxID=701041 RepID=A0AAW5SBH4_MYCBC|nr:MULTISPECIES: hypothetical protein [Mycobacterium avium complex (MAC)]MCV6991882.1 hypothetical protein [Mycobacterium bouchedurhonense]MCV6993703.1 hypothetical protein [Mycobacterium timonense]MDV3306917.1 hypothetical protein [Mycobacterium avium subsp. hominissuis]
MDIKPGDRIRNIYGFAGTVLQVYTDEGLAHIRYDDEQRGRIVGRDWHSKISELEPE